MNCFMNDRTCGNGCMAYRETAQTSSVCLILHAVEEGIKLIPKRTPALEVKHPPSPPAPEVR